MSIFKRLALTILVSAFTICTWAEGRENSLENFFITMPDDEIEYLNMSLKSEMVELYKIGATGKVINLLGGESWITHMDSMRIDIVLANEKCYMTINTIEQKRGKKLYAIVKTIYTPIADSDICFYNEKLEKVDSENIFEYPKFKDFFSETNNKSLNEVMKKISMMFLKVEISENGNLMVTLNDMWLDVLDKEISNTLLQIKRKNPLCYSWSGKRFKLIEN